VTRALATHWREYLIEGWGLGTFMLSACLFCALLEHPSSPLRAAIGSGTLRRVLMGIAMGATAMAIIYSPWGERSGAHLNPAVTLTFLRLGRVGSWDAFFYVVAQLVGGAAGVLASRAILGRAIAHPTVAYVVTVPGAGGARVALVAELVISFVLMFAVLAVSANARAARYTGVVAGALVAAYIAIEAPYSGMSMNPARTIASAVVAREWTGLWIYLCAPPIAMLLAAETYLATLGTARDACAKLHHAPDVPCIFCGSGERAAN
jgi:aquaporin Z